MAWFADHSAFCYFKINRNLLLLVSRRDKQTSVDFNETDYWIRKPMVWIGIVSKPTDLSNKINPSRTISEYNHRILILVMLQRWYLTWKFFSTVIQWTSMSSSLFSTFFLVILDTSLMRNIYNYSRTKINLGVYED